MGTRLNMSLEHLSTCRWNTFNMSLKLVLTCAFSLFDSYLTYICGPHFNMSTEHVNVHSKSCGTCLWKVFRYGRGACLTFLFENFSNSSIWIQKIFLENVSTYIWTIFYHTRRAQHVNCASLCLD